MTYLLNGLVSSQPMAVITTPADTIFVHEYKANSRVAQARPNPTGTLPVTAATQWNQFNHAFYDRLHSGGANFLFCDGHAKWQQKKATRFKQFGADTSTLADPNQAFQNPTNGCNDTACPDTSISLKSLFPPAP